MLINDVCRIIGEDTNSFEEIRGSADSIAGLLLELLGQIPEQGEEVEYDKFSFKVISVSTRRIEKVRLRISK